MNSLSSSLEGPESSIVGRPGARPPPRRRAASGARRTERAGTSSSKSSSTPIAEGPDGAVAAALPAASLQLPAHELELALVLVVLRLAPHEDLEDGRGLVQLALR